MANTLAHARQRFFDAQGVPLAFGKVWTYNAGTNVPRPTFADAGEVTANPNPVILDVNGEATIYWRGTYKVNLTTSADAQVPGWPEDDVTDITTLVNASVDAISTDIASTASGKGAALVGVQDAVGRVSAANAEAWLAALSDPEILANAQTGIDPTGATESTSVIQACIDAMALQTHGGRVVLRGTYLVDTLLMKSNVALDMTAGARLNFKAHTTSHNPVIRMGDASAAISGAKVLGGEIDGNSANQTFASEEWSHGVFIWGSDDCEVRGVKIHDTKGDGVTIGYDSGRVVGGNRNKVVDCEIYNPSVSPGRMCIAITYGNENRIINNKCSGAIDLELNASIGECKNNLVLGNTGRAQTENLTGPRLSDLVISLASMNTDPLRYYGNEVIANHCRFISMQYNKKSLITGNVVVGSVSTQARLIDVGGCDDTVISGNQLDGNAAVATGLTDIIRTRGCAVLQVTNNQVRGDAVSTRPFHNFVNTFAASTAADHIFLNNQTESGWYRNGACQQPTEKARFRINQDPAGSLTATQISGVKCNFSISRSGTNMVVTQVGNCGAQYLIQLDAQCNATTTSANPNITHNAAHTYTISGSNRTVTVLTFAPAAGAVTLAAFSFAVAGGTGTFFMDVTF